MEIKETSFGPKKYITLNKSISTDQVSDKQMYDETGKKLDSFVKDNNLTISGPWSVLYFSWDRENKKTDIGISFPIMENVTDTGPELSITEIPQRKAIMAVMQGPYDGLSSAHESLGNYMSQKKYSQKNVSVMALEEYAVGPMQNSNPKEWVTNIYYFYD